MIADATDGGIAVAFDLKMNQLPAGEYLTAFESRLVKTCCNRRSSANVSFTSSGAEIWTGHLLLVTDCSSSTRRQKQEKSSAVAGNPACRPPPCRARALLPSVRHAPRVLANGQQLFAAIFGFELFEIVFKNLRRRHDNAQRAKLVRDHRNEIALELAEFFFAREGF